jgi:hypothetical protein
LHLPRRDHDLRRAGSAHPDHHRGSAEGVRRQHVHAHDADSQGHQPGVIFARPGQSFYSAAQLSGWRTLRQVRYAGSFEGQTTVTGSN